MNEPVDMIRFVADLVKRPKGKAAIVLTHDYGGQKQWATDLAVKTEAEHLPMLDIFSEQPQLSNNLSLFTVSELFDFIHRQSKKNIAIISGLEFLKSTWSGQISAKNQFANHIQTWHRTPHILFVIQYDTDIASYDFGRRYSYRFVVDQKDTFKL